ncbi:MAG: hypothetical protein ACI92Z_001032 [Paracoccaceae bacterium]|jgi:hypothetical protein
MTSRGALWAGGVAGSALVHGVVLGLLLIAVDPEPVTEQAMPTSEIEVQAYQLDRTTAQEQSPQSQPTETHDASGAHVAAGAIPRSRASAVEAPAQTLPSADPPASDVVRVTGPDSAPLAQVQRSEQISDVKPATAPVPTADPPASDVVRVTGPDSAPLAQVKRSEQISDVKPATAPVPTAAMPAPENLTVITKGNPPLSQVRPAAMVTASAQPVPILLAAVVRTQPVLAQIQPIAVLMTSSATPAAIIPVAVQATLALPSLTNTDTPAPAVAPSSAPVPQATPIAHPSPQTPPNARKLKAALAFSGDGGGEVDPVSLAAFQSFMQPGDIKISGDALRDGVSTLLAQVPCSRLQVGFDPDTATLQVNGHIPDSDLRGPVLAALQAQMGTDIVVSDKILILPRPQCGALSGIADVGLPQSTDQNTNPRVIGADAHVRELEFVENDRLFFDITAPDYDAWVYVDYFDADGNVLHLAPNDQIPLTLSAAGSALRIGAKQAGDAGLQILIGPPYGQEITVAFAASESLYDGLRPIIEPAAPYLEWLKTRVAEARTLHTDFKGEWVYFFVTTSQN